MEINIKNFYDENSMKYVGFKIKQDGNTLAIDKQVPLVDGKTNEQYVQEALALCQTEIEDWKNSFALIGKKWNPDTNSFE
jgi:hypothetical protein